MRLFWDLARRLQGSSMAVEMTTPWFETGSRVLALTRSALSSVGDRRLSHRPSLQQRIIDVLSSNLGREPSAPEAAAEIAADPQSVEPDPETSTRSETQAAGCSRDAAIQVIGEPVLRRREEIAARVRELMAEPQAASGSSVQQPVQQRLQIPAGTSLETSSEPASEPSSGTRETVSGTPAPQDPAIAGRVAPPSRVRIGPNRPVSFSETRQSSHQQWRPVGLLAHLSSNGMRSGSIVFAVGGSSAAPSARREVYVDSPQEARALRQALSAGHFQGETLELPCCEWASNEMIQELEQLLAHRLVRGCTISPGHFMMDLSLHRVLAENRVGEILSRMDHKESESQAGR